MQKKHLLGRNDRSQRNRAISRFIQVIFVSLFHVSVAGAIEVDKEATVADATTTVMGINHIGLSVQDLEQMLAFYQVATGFELVVREKVTANKAADNLYGQPGIAYERAVLKAPNMMFELIEFSHNKSVELSTMPVQGPGMTHTCFQSPMAEPGYDKFMAVGADPLSRGDQPVDLGGYGVTYAYAHDPEGNMFEMEQLDGVVLKRAGYDNAWQELDVPLWMSQVGIVTHDLEALMQFYEKVLGFKSYRVTAIRNNTKVDDIANIDNVVLNGGWFKLNKNSKVLELWEYVEPSTKKFDGVRGVSDLGYSYSFEVGDIHAEYNRLLDLGVKFVSSPVVLNGFWQVYANDIHGNVFALRQVIDDESPYSVRSLDQ